MMFLVPDRMIQRKIVYDAYTDQALTVEAMMSDKLRTYIKYMDLNLRYELKNDVAEYLSNKGIAYKNTVKIDITEDLITELSEYQQAFIEYYCTYSTSSGYTELLANSYKSFIDIIVKRTPFYIDMDSLEEFTMMVMTL